MSAAGTSRKPSTPSRFDKHRCRWTILGDAGEVRRSDQRGRILSVLADASEPLGPADIAGAAGMSANNAKQLLFKMAGAGEVEKASRGQYVHPDNRHLVTPDNFDNPVTSDK